MTVFTCPSCGDLATGDLFDPRRHPLCTCSAPPTRMLPPEEDRPVFWLTASTKVAPAPTSQVAADPLDELEQLEALTGELLR